MSRNEPGLLGTAARDASRSVPGGRSKEPYPVNPANPTIVSPAVVVVSPAVAVVGPVAGYERATDYPASLAIIGALRRHLAPRDDNGLGMTPRPLLARPEHRPRFLEGVRITDQEHLVADLERRRGIG